MEQKQNINDHGLYLSGNHTPFPVKALLLDEIEKEDYIIICVKQSQVSTILTKLNKDDQDTPVVFLQNGMGHIEQLNETNKTRSEEHTSELQSRGHLVCRLLLEKKNEN